MSVPIQIKTARHAISLNLDTIPQSYVNNVENSMVFVIGPAGAGKSTLAHELEIISNGDIKLANFLTTRSRNLNEMQWSGYSYISDNEFDSKINDGSVFLWHKTPIGSLGLELNEVINAINSGIKLIVPMRTHGGIKRIFPLVPVIELTGMTTNILKKRILQRNRQLVTPLDILLNEARLDLIDNINERNHCNCVCKTNWLVLENITFESPISKTLVYEAVKFLSNPNQ